MAVVIKKSIPEQVIEALDGRTQRWLALEIKMPEDSLSRKLKGAMAFTDSELDAIEKRLDFKFKK